MSANTKNRAVVFWSAYYLPLLQIFLFALVDGVGFWVLFGSFVFVVAGTLFGTFRDIKNLPSMSKFIAGVVLPLSVVAALVVRGLAENYLLVGFFAFAALVIISAASAMQLHFANATTERRGDN